MGLDFFWLKKSIETVECTMLLWNHAQFLTIHKKFSFTSVVKKNLINFRKLLILKNKSFYFCVLLTTPQKKFQRAKEK